MSSGSIYAQLRSWYTGWRSANDSGNGSENAGVKNTGPRDKKHSVDEDTRNTVQNPRADLLGGSHIVGRPWPAPEQALRDTLSKANLLPPPNRPDAKDVKADEGTNKDQSPTEVTPEQEIIGNSKIPPSDVHAVTPEPEFEPSIPQSPAPITETKRNPNQNLTADKEQPASLSKPTSQPPSIKPDQSGLTNMKSKKLRKRLERGKSASTVAKATGPTPTSHAVPPTTQQSQASGAKSKKTESKHSLTDPEGSNNIPESKNAVSINKEQRLKGPDSTSNADDPISEAQPHPTGPNKDAVPHVAVADTEEAKPTDASSERKVDDASIGHDPSTGLNTSGTTPDNAKAIAEVDTAGRKEDASAPIVSEAPPHAASDDKVPASSRATSSQPTPAKDTSVKPSTKHSQLTVSDPVPAASISGDPDKESKKAETEPINKTKSPSKVAKQEADKTLSSKAQLAQSQSSRRRINYLSYVDTSLLYEIPPLGPTRFFPKEAFPKVEPLQAF